MLTSLQESQLFESLARSHPALTTWLQGELAKTTKTLISAVEIDQLRRAQGAAQLAKLMLDRLEHGLAPKR
jgi:hypothetical protein